MADKPKLEQIGGLRTRTSKTTGDKFYVGFVKQDGKYINFIMFKNKWKDKQLEEGKIKDPYDYNIFLSQDRPQAAKAAVVKPVVKKTAPEPQPEAEELPPLGEDESL